VDGEGRSNTKRLQNRLSPESREPFTLPPEVMTKPLVTQKKYRSSRTESSYSGRKPGGYGSTWILSKMGVASHCSKAKEGGTRDSTGPGNIGLGVNCAL